jgi:uracil-DNA glycosylase
LIQFQDRYHETAYNQHYRRWEGCELCPFHENRRKIVLYRGKLPCDILFIGEAPGGDENQEGYPFIGQAGSVLQAAIDALNVELTELDLPALSFGITNVVACFPGKDSHNRFNKPDDEHADACRDRLVEMVELASPKLVVLLGEVSKTFCTKISGYRTVHVYHPSFILRRGGIDSAAYRSWWNELAKEVAAIYAKVPTPKVEKATKARKQTQSGKSSTQQTRAERTVSRFNQQDRQSASASRPRR